MAIVSSNVRRYAKNRPIPLVEKMASAQLGGMTKATEGVPNPEITSPLQSRLNYEQALGRTTPSANAPNAPNAPNVQNMQPTPDQTGQMGQMGQPTQQDQAGQSGQNNMDLTHYVAILQILPPGIKVLPLRVLFTPPALVDFSTKAQQQGMTQTAQMVNSSSQGSNITGQQVEQTAISELSLVQQQSQAQTSSPLQQRISSAGSLGNMGNMGQPAGIGGMGLGTA